MPAPEGEHGAPEPTLPDRLLVAVFAVGAVVGPYLLRSLDDNRLASWRWVFAARSPVALLGLALGAALLAQFVARFTPARRREALLFLGAYAMGACSWSEPEPIVDAARYFTQAKHLALYGVGHFLREWGREIPAWTDLPLVPFLYGLVLRLSGESRLAVEAFGTLLFAGAAVLTARIGRALWDEGTGLAAGALLLASPYLLAQVPLMLVDVPTLFFVALATHASLRALQQPTAARVVLAGFAVFLALLSKYSAGLFLTALPVAAVALGRSPGAGPGEGGTAPARPAGAAAHALRRLSILAAVALVAAALSLAVLVPLRDVFSRQLSLLLGYQAPGLRRWGESFLSTFVFQVHPFVGAAALASVWVAWRRRDPAWLVAAWPVLLLLVLGVRRIRYLLPALPMLALLAAYGLHALRARETRRAVVACAVLSAFALGLYGYGPFLRGTSAINLKAAGAFLDRLEEERVEVMTASAPEPAVNPAVSIPLLDLFTAKRLVYRDEAIPRPPAGRLETSALRFTWELPAARWYAPGPPQGRAAVAVISDGAAPLPARVTERLAGHVLDRAFDTDEDLFQHRTRVEVYRLRP